MGGRRFIFWLELLYLAILGAVAYLYFTNRSAIPLPDSLGSVPLGVLYFGALGGVLISLSGVFQFRKDWDQDYRYWHWARPAVGAAVAVISVLIFQAGILAVGSTPAPSAQPGPKNILYYLIAFLVGYREQTFRELLKRLTDIILTTGPTGARDVVSSRSEEKPPGGT